MKSHFRSLLFSAQRPQVLQFLRQLSSSSTSTNKARWNSKTNVIITNPTLLILESCTTMLELKQIQAQMTCSGLITDTFPLSRVLAFCALADGGDIQYAHLLFTHIEEPNTYMWNTMIRGYSNAQIPTTGFSIFGQMVGERVEMDSRSFVFALKACEKLTRMVEGDSAHCLIWKMGFDSDLLVRNGLLHYYAEGGFLSLARQVFDESPVRDVFTWTTMIDGYAARCWSDEAMKLFYSMLLSDVEPNEVTMIAVLSACSEKGDIDTGKKIHEYIQKKKVHCSLNLLNALLDMFVKCGCLLAAQETFDKMKVKDVFSWTSMVNGYARFGDVDSARKLFNDMPERNVASWNAMIAGYTQNNRPNEGLELFHEMVEAGLAPTENSLVCVLSACGQSGCLDLGQSIHWHYLNRKPSQLSVILANALMDMYAKCGSLNSAKEVFSKIPDRNLVSWNTMIAGFAGHAKEALALFNQMKDMGLKPDHVTFVAVLSACSHGGLVSEGREHFKSMARDFRLEPKEEHYACMIDLLGRVGFVEEAYDIINKMPMEPSEAAWGALLNACKIHGNVEMAKISAKKLLELNHEDSGVYVLLANLCADEKRWDDVRMVRRLMKERGVKKNPGHSLIEVEGEFHQFLAADKSHPQAQEIYNVLNEIYLFLKLECYVPNILMHIH